MSESLVGLIVAAMRQNGAWSDPIRPVTVTGHPAELTGWANVMVAWGNDRFASASQESAAAGVAPSSATAAIDRQRGLTRSPPRSTSGTWLWARPKYQCGNFESVIHIPFSAFRNAYDI
jgi:hypothetical protein